MKKIIITCVFLSCLCAGFKIPFYSAYVDKARGSEARIYINTIYKQAVIYYTEVGNVPASLYEMKEQGLLSLDAKAELEWNFDLSQLQEPSGEEARWGLEGQITATSTEEMAGGEGEIVVYNVETGEWCGYGHKQCWDE